MNVGPGVLSKGNGGETLVPKELSESFFLKRQPLVVSIKSFRRHQAGKRVWNIARWKLLRGIRAYHKSVEGKKFHRALGRFLATRLFFPHQLSGERGLFQSNEALKAITSTRTFYYIAREYYRPLDEEVDLELFGDYALPLLWETESKLITSPLVDLSADIMELLLRLVERGELIRCFKEVKPELIQTHLETLASLAEDAEGETEGTYQLLEWCKILGATIPLVDTETQC